MYVKGINHRLRLKQDSFVCHNSGFIGARILLNKIIQILMIKWSSRELWDEGCSISKKNIKCN